MGDNATKKWEWHNTVVGEGYAAKGVIRQKTATSKPVQIVDLSKPLHEDESAVADHGSTMEKAEEQERHDRKRERKEESKKGKKHEKKRHRHGGDDKSNDASSSELGFHPLLQLLARRLRENQQ